MTQLKYFELLPEDIAHGKRTDSQHCPIANAIRRTLDLPVGKVKVGSLYVTINDEDWVLGETARSLIFAFDMGLDIKPEPQFEIWEAK